MTKRPSRRAYENEIADFNVGDVIEHWPGRTITEYDDMSGALLTVNLAPLHIDEAYSQRTQHGKRLTNGLLIIAIVLGMANRDTTGRDAGLFSIESANHSLPTYYGDTIYATTTIDAIEPHPDGSGELSTTLVAVNSSGEEILSLKRKVWLPAPGVPQRQP